MTKILLFLLLPWVLTAEFTPVVSRQYGFGGGSGQEQARDVAFDKYGNIWQAGSSSSSGTIGTVGAYDRTVDFGCGDGCGGGHARA